jgi:hypothetical protein
MVPPTPEESATQGMMGLGPAVINANFRSPEIIQQLRKFIAQEQRARGPMGQDIPIDQILRGSWYHGMSDKARNAVWEGGGWNPSEGGLLSAANEAGFPLSLHDSASISNKLGEPAGISLSMLPSVSQKFSADEYIHRVLPLYGGQPTERIVNLLRPEGRNFLNDAYDTVINKSLGNRLPNLSERFNRTLMGTPGSLWNPPEILEDLFNTVPSSMLGQVGSFNQQLSTQLQSMGKRGILYNPQRWSEYEMLMLDPSYVKPLDYRKMEEYIPKANKLEQMVLSHVMSPTNTDYATPGIKKGLSQIGDEMAQNKSRLGDIYSERPWAQRLDDENRRRLLEMLDPSIKDTVTNQLGW